MEACIKRLAQHLGGELAILHGHGGERHEEGIIAHALQHVLIQEAAPVSALFGGNVVAEHIEPAANDLLVDVLVGQPFAAALGVAHALGDRAFRLVLREGETHGLAIHHHLDGGKLAGVVGQIFNDGGRNIMGVGVDDHWASPGLN